MERELIGHLNKVHRINSFEELNWIDPFPTKVSAEHADKKLSKIQNIEDLVYDESKFIKTQPPNMVFLPNRMILRKIMKVCAGVSDYTQLYYFF